MQKIAYNAGDQGSIPDQQDSLEKELATHSSTLAWEIPCTEEPGRLQSMQLLDTNSDKNGTFHKHSLQEYTGDKFSLVSLKHPKTSFQICFSMLE